MATKKISELTLVLSVDGTETFPILKSGFNYKMTVAQIKSWIGNATSAVAGLLSATDKSKLDSVETGATANASNAALRDRSTHTGTQSASTITGLADVATSGDYDDLTGKPANATTSVSGLMSSTDKTKLDGVATSATANATDAQLRDRSTHTGTQAASTITGLGAVATSNSYNDLSNRPIDTNYVRLPTVAFQSATGTTAGTATLISKSVFHVGSSDASNKGIILPANMTLGTEFSIFNGTGNAINVYPPTGGQINYAGVNTPYALGAYNPLRVVLIDAANGVYQQI
ncbi:hypothetical protein [Sphingobium fuliginis]|uniref:Uncharacterized protein n=1 Tax=Sphingobium fuliginis ATCC 27551 TaxID=1208342 RepID=A0A5B8CHR4_SPHSA|nr:hypothetical protein [Sphingobium fuliginis]QDC38699.1 hypothetical protein FIL70_17080 [Sphingobium fuliginis ATCC 27551]